jgi:FixJ family two-component response regulator
MERVDNFKRNGRTTSTGIRTIRMVLSGNADSALIMKAVDVTHHFISKPCDPETLRSIVGRALSL